MKKYFFSLILPVCLVLSMMVGCGSDETADSAQPGANGTVIDSGETDTNNDNMLDDAGDAVNDAVDNGKEAMDDMADDAKKDMDKAEENMTNTTTSNNTPATNNTAGSNPTTQTTTTD